MQPLRYKAAAEICTWGTCKGIAVRGVLQGSVLGCAAGVMHRPCL